MSIDDPTLIDTERRTAEMMTEPNAPMIELLQEASPATDAHYVQGEDPLGTKGELTMAVKDGYTLMHGAPRRNGRMEVHTKNSADFAAACAHHGVRYVAIHRWNVHGFVSLDDPRASRVYWKPELAGGEQYAPPERMTSAEFLRQLWMWEAIGAEVSDVDAWRSGLRTFERLGRNDAKVEYDDRGNVMLSGVVESRDVKVKLPPRLEVGGIPAFLDDGVVIRCPRLWAVGVDSAREGLELELIDTLETSKPWDRVADTARTAIGRVYDELELHYEVWEGHRQDVDVRGFEWWKVQK